MDEKPVKMESKFGPGCNDGVDRISQLPEDIIVHVLSYLLLKTAATTSVLSTRWLHLWRYIPFLYFNEKDSGRSKFVEWVNSIVEKHKAHSLKCLSVSCKLDKSSHSAITKWLEFAFSKRVEVVDLYFAYDIDKENAVVLDKLLRLRPSNLLKSSNLKSLCLGNLKASGEAIKLILRGCHLLEQMKFFNAVFTSDIEVCGGASGLVLKHLEISCCRGGKRVHVSAVNLTFLKIYSNRDVLFQVENVPKLVEVKFCSSRASNIQEFCFVSQLKVLTIYPFLPQDFLAKEIPTMPNLMELNVSYYGRSKYFVPTLASLVRASPLLRTFNLQQCIHWEHWEHWETDMEVENVEACKHYNLRVFRFSTFDVDVADHMELVSYILDNCVALRKLIIKDCRKNVDLLPLNISPETISSKREATMEKAKQLIRPKLPAHIQLEVII